MTTTLFLIIIAALILFILAAKILSSLPGIIAGIVCIVCKIAVAIACVVLLAGVGDFIYQIVEHHEEPKAAASIVLQQGKTSWNYISSASESSVSGVKNVATNAKNAASNASVEVSKKVQEVSK